MNENSTIGDIVRKVKENFNLPFHHVYWAKNGDEAVVKLWDDTKKGWIEHSRHTL